MDDKPKISFDKEYKIRILDPAKAEHAEELNTECSGFVESMAPYRHTLYPHTLTRLFILISEIADFNGKINGLVEVLEQHAKRIDDQKLRVY